MSYYSTHRRKVKKTIVVNILQVENGDILFFRYDDKKGKSSLKIALALNIWPIGSGKKGRYLHALDLAGISPVELKRFLTFLQDPSTIKEEDAFFRRVAVPPSPRLARQFYAQKVRRFGNLMDTYRTYKLDSITQVRAAEYDFGSDILPQSEIERLEGIDED
jgi:hypothetical protein